MILNLKNFCFILLIGINVNILNNNTFGWILIAISIFLTYYSSVSGYIKKEIHQMKIERTIKKKFSINLNTIYEYIINEYAKVLGNPSYLELRLVPGIESEESLPKHMSKQLITHVLEKNIQKNDYRKEIYKSTLIDLIKYRPDVEFQEDIRKRREEMIELKKINLQEYNKLQKQIDNHIKWERNREIEYKKEQEQELKDFYGDAYEFATKHKDGIQKRTGEIWKENYKELAELILSI